MTTTKFQPVTVAASRRGKCPACGKTTTRARTFSETVNPWNQHEDGTPKTYYEVYESVLAKAGAWNPHPEVFRHNTDACDPVDSPAE